MRMPGSQPLRIPTLFQGSHSHKVLSLSSLCPGCVPHPARASACLTSFQGGSREAQVKATASGCMALTSGSILFLLLTLGKLFNLFEPQLPQILN